MPKAILRDSQGVEQDRVSSDQFNVLLELVSSVLVPGAGPGDTIEFGEPDHPS
jgi:hypothetical protein